MSTFVCPKMVSAVPNAGPRDPILVQRCMSHFSRGDRYYNVWIVDNLTAQNYQPTATYNSDGSLNQTGLERTNAFFQGGITYSVTAAQATILTNSGFTVT